MSERAAGDPDGPVGPEPGSGEGRRIGRVRLLAVLARAGFRQGRSRSSWPSNWLLSVGYHALMWAKWQAAGVARRGVSLYPSRDALQVAVASLAPAGGLWLEFGVWKGDSLNRLARHARGEVVGFDSFEGLPDAWVRGFGRGAFSTDGELPVVEPNVTLVKGRFEETLPPFLERRGKLSIALAHLDCDLYEGTRVVLAALEPALLPGAILLFDEFTGIPPDDEARAFREQVVRRGWRYRVVGVAPNGAVAVQLGPRPDDAPRGQTPFRSVERAGGVP